MNPPLLAPEIAPEIARLATMRGFIALSLPLAAGMGVGWVMQFTNRLFLSWYSPDALAASLPAGMMTYMIQAFFIASAGYVGAFAAQHAGAQEPEEAGAMAWPMLWLSLAAGLLSLALIPFRHVIFAIFETEPAVRADMTTLGAWYMAETLPAVVLAGISSWFGGLGRTKLVLAISGGVCVLSVVLNRWLIFGGAGVPALGIHGAGLATVLATMIGSGVALAYFFGPATRAQFGTWRRRNLSVVRMWLFARSAVPRGATDALEMVAFVIFTAAIAHLGSDALAANNLVLSLYLVTIVPLIGFGQGVTIGVGQALGAGRIDIARLVTRNCALLMCAILICTSALFTLAPRLLMSPYIAIDPTDALASAARWERIITLSLPLMWICAGMFIADGLQIVFRFAVQGAGDTRWPLMALTIASFVVLGAPTLVLSWWVPAATWEAWGLNPLTGCWLAFAAYLWLIAAVMAWRYYRGPWTTMSLRR
jgi:MATE family multidrug resistance protein